MILDERCLYYGEKAKLYKTPLDFILNAKMSLNF